MQVRDLMTECLYQCTPDSGLEDVAKMMIDCDCGAIPVVDRETNKALGIVTDRDITCRAVGQGRNPLDMRVEEVMTMPITAVSPDASLRECELRMEEAQVRRMPVVDEAGRLCGIVSQADIARATPKEETGELVREISRPWEEASQVQ